MSKLLTPTLPAAEISGQGLGPGHALARLQDPPAVLEAQELGPRAGGLLEEHRVVGHDRQGVGEAEAVEQLQGRVDGAAQDLVEPGLAHRHPVLGAQDLRPEVGEGHLGVEDVEARRVLQGQPVLHLGELALAGDPLGVEDRQALGGQQQVVVGDGGVAGDDALDRAHLFVDRPQLLAGRVQGAADPAEGVDGLLEAEAVGVVVEGVGPEGLGGQEVGEVAEGGRVPEPGVPELLGRHREVELGQGIGPDLAHLQLELVDGLAGAADGGVAVQGELHRLGEGEGEGLGRAGRPLPRGGRFGPGRRRGRDRGRGAEGEDEDGEGSCVHGVSSGGPSLSGRRRSGSRRGPG